MVPAAIGSERKRHMPTSTPAVPPQPSAPSTINDWPSVSKRKLPFSHCSLFSSLILFFIRLEPYPYPQQPTRDYLR